MSSPVVLLPIEQNSVEDRVELLARLWDSLLDTSGLPAMPAWHATEVARRIAHADGQPDSAIPLAQLKQELLGDTR